MSVIEEWAVGAARCAVSAAFSGATNSVERTGTVIRSARYCAGGDIAARSPHHASVAIPTGHCRPIVKLTKRDFGHPELKRI